MEKTDYLDYVSYLAEYYFQPVPVPKNIEIACLAWVYDINSKKANGNRERFEYIRNSYLWDNAKKRGFYHFRYFDEMAKDVQRVPSKSEKNLVEYYLKFGENKTLIGITIEFEIKEINEIPILILRQDKNS